MHPSSSLTNSNFHFSSATTTPEKFTDTRSTGSSAGTCITITPSRSSALQLRSELTTYFLRNSNNFQYQDSTSSSSCHESFDLENVSGSCGSGTSFQSNFSNSKRLPSTTAFCNAGSPKSVKN